MSLQRLSTFAGSTQVVWRSLGATSGDTRMPLVLLHGGHGSWQHWVRNVAQLSDHYGVWVPDLPGYGESDTPPEPTMQSLVNTLRAALDQLLGAGTPVRLAGFSFGGLVAAHIAAQRPHISHLGLVGPAGHGSARRPKGALQDWREAARGNDDLALRQCMHHNLLMHMLENATAVDEQALSLHTAACLNSRFHSKKISLSGGLFDALAIAQRVNPTMALSAIWGEHDVTCTPLSVLRAMQMAGIALQREQIVPQAGHWVQYEAADISTDFLLRAMAAT